MTHPRPIDISMPCPSCGRELRSDEPAPMPDLPNTFMVACGPCGYLGTLDAETMRVSPITQSRRDTLLARFPMWVESFLDYQVRAAWMRRERDRLAEAYTQFFMGLLPEHHYSEEMLATLRAERAATAQELAQIAMVAEFHTHMPPEFAERMRAAYSWSF